MRFSRAKETWYIKLDGPEERVSGHAAEFAGFVKSLEFDDGKNAAKPVHWTKPDKWLDIPPPKPIQYAAFNVESRDKPLLLTVTKLGALEANGANTLLGNINRWRGQIGLPAWTEADLTQETKPIPLAGVQVTLVDFLSSSKPKHAEMVPPVGNRRPPVDANSPKYKAPEGWVRAQPAISDMLLKFTIKSDSATADVSFSLMKQQELLGNVNRWRGQLDLPPIGQVELNKSVTSIDLPLGKGDYVDLQGKSKRMLAVIAARGNSSCVFKLTGDSKLVENQKSAFEAFMKSVQLD